MSSSFDVLAFTIGFAPNYDRCLVEKKGFKKLGRRPDYEGGWIWRTSEEAAAFIKSGMAGTDRRPEDYAVYGVILPNGWDEDVSLEPSPKDGVHRLLADAVIVKLEKR